MPTVKEGANNHQSTLGKFICFSSSFFHAATAAASVSSRAAKADGYFATLNDYRDSASTALKTLCIFGRARNVVHIDFFEVNAATAKVVLGGGTIGTTNLGKDFR